MSVDLDNASVAFAIDLQLRDLDTLVASGEIDAAVAEVQRKQLQVDAGIDAVAFGATRRLAINMARAVEDDLALLARMTRSRQIDDATY